MQPPEHSILFQPQISSFFSNFVILIFSSANPFDLLIAHTMNRIHLNRTLMVIAQQHNHPHFSSLNSFDFKKEEVFAKYYLFQI